MRIRRIAKRWRRHGPQGRGLAYLDGNRQPPPACGEWLPFQLHKDMVTRNLFTTITMLGTPHDATVHELRLESFFPADAASRRWFEAQAARE